MVIVQYQSDGNNAHQQRRIGRLRPNDVDEVTPPVKEQESI
jgi:hypothetical protein